MISKSFKWHVLTIIQFTQIPVPSPSKMPPLSLSSLEHFIPATSCIQGVLENAGVIHGRYLNELPLLPPFMPSLPVVFFFAAAPVVESAVYLGQLYGILTNWNLRASASQTLQKRSTTCDQQNHKKKIKHDCWLVCLLELIGSSKWFDNLLTFLIFESSLVCPTAKRLCPLLQQFLAARGCSINFGGAFWYRIPTAKNKKTI